MAARLQAARSRPRRQGPTSPGGAVATLLVLATACISYSFMQTLVLPALPFFQREFHASETSVAWIATAFFLTSSVLTPIVGRLGDAHGKVRVLAMAMAIFGIATLAAAFAPNLGWLVACRAVQGIGGAVFPLSFAIVRDEFPPDRVSLGIGTVSSAFGVGSGIGFLLSGLVLENLSWHWLFVIGLIPTVAAVVLIPLLIVESPVRAATRPDWLGGIALSAALFTSLLAVTEGNSWGWSSARVLGLFGTGALLAVTWVAVERRVPDPMVDMSVFARPAMAVINLATFLVGFTMFSAYVLLPGFVAMPAELPADVASQVHYGFDASPLAVGLFFMPTAVLMLVAGPLAGELGGRRGCLRVLQAGVWALTASLAMLAILNSASWEIFVSMALLGIGVATCVAALGMLVIDCVAADQTGIAGGMNTIMRTIGGAVGGQVGAAVIAGWTVAGTAVPAKTGYTVTFLLAAAVGLLALLMTALLRERPQGLSVVLRGAEPSRAEPSRPSAG